MKFDGFDWDKGNLEKCQKHGVLIEEIESLFAKKIYVTPDKKHSGTEQRFISVGISRSERHVFMIFTLRRQGDDLLIRPISARYMHKKEVEAYEKEISRVQNR